MRRFSIAIIAVIGVTALTLVPAVVTASASAGRAKAPASAPTRATRSAAAKERAARAFLETLHIGSPVHTRPLGTSSPGSIPKSTSHNWSGYADTSLSKGNYRDITSNWHVPAIVAGDCTHGTFNTGEGLAAFWVGIDGSGSNTVEQAGTADECYQGTAYYYDWYEMYPGPIVVASSVNPGDLMSVTVDFTGAYYELSVVDSSSSSIDVSTIQACGGTCNNGRRGDRGSGQTCRGSYFLMPHFDPVGFYVISDSTFDYGGSIGTGAFGLSNITMINSANVVLSKVTKLVKNDGFVVIWFASG